MLHVVKQRNNGARNRLPVFKLALVLSIVVLFCTPNILARSFAGAIASPSAILDPVKIDLQKSVSGHVTDTQGLPLAGASIVEKGTQNGVVADFDGNFNLTLTTSQAVLVISYVGFQSLEIPVGGRIDIQITLQEDTASLDEVVVIGYGSVKKSDITGAVSSIELDEMSQGVVTSVDQLMVGKSSGVNVVQGSGEPGAGFALNIRGATSVNASNGPLYVIDGLPLDNSKPIRQNGVGIGNSRTPRNPLATINPNDIESIEILKDASATAIYGSRGANGVVLITTKSGKEGKPKFSYSGYSGFQNWHNELDLLNAEEYKRVLNAIIDDGGGEENLRVGDDIANTNWQDEIQNKNAPVHSHQFSVGGGTESLKYFASLNILEQDGIVKSSYFKRYGGRVNLESQISQKIKLGLRLAHSHNRDSYVPNGGASIDNSGALQAAYTYDPTIPVFNQDGTYARNELISVDNPLALINGIDSKSKTNFTLVAASLQYNFNENWNVKTNFGRDYSSEIRKTFVSDITRIGEQSNGLGNQQNAEKDHILFDGTLNYNFNTKNHNVNAVLGASYERYIQERSSISASDFPSLILGANNLALGNRENFVLSNGKFSNSLASLFGRVNYTLKNKYIFTATARLDGSSRFGDNNKYGLFPSGAFAWKIAEEEFLKTSNFLEDLKIRLSWGQSGNQEISNYAALSTYGIGQFAVFDDQAVTTTTPIRLPNPDLKWETTEQIDIGLDFSFWNNRLNGSFDYYRKTTSDLLIELPIPSSTGFNTRLSNIGEVRNIGYELSLESYNINIQGFKWSTSITLSTIENEVLSLGPVPEIINTGAFTWLSGDAIIVPGEAMYSFYGWETNGIWQIGDDYSVTTDNVSPGDIKFVDQNGDGTVNADDRVILGDSFPDLQFALGNTFTVGNFELFVFLDGMTGVEMLNAKLVETYYPINFRRNKFAEPYLNRWTPENPSNEYPSFVNPTNQGAKGVNSFTVEDASYLKLRTIRLSYNLNDALGIGAAQIYITGENLYTWTDYSGIDPALNSNGNANYRIDLNSYPSARTVLVGVNLDF